MNLAVGALNGLGKMVYGCEVRMCPPVGFPPRQVMRRIAYLLIPVLILCVSAFVVAQKATLTEPTQMRSMKNASGTVAAKKVAALRPGQEARALWVVRYTMAAPEALRDAIKRAKENGFTDLIVQIRGRGDAFYDSKWEPRAEELQVLPEDFDPLEVMIREAHAEGLRVHAWINAFLVANVGTLPNLPDHIIYKHPEWLMVPRQLARQLYGMNPKSPEYLTALRDYTRAHRDVLEGIYASPANPEVRQHLRNIWLDVLSKYDVDGLHFDYVRYPNSNFDFNRNALDQFQAEVDAGLSEKDKATLHRVAARNPLIYAATFYDRYAAFQRRQVTETVESIFNAVKARDPEVTVSAAVAADYAEGYRSRFQDWKAWLRKGILDVVCPMAYTPSTEVFRKQMAEAVTLSGSQSVWGGIGSWRQPVDGTLEKIRVARKLGAQGFILFSYDSAVQFSALNPQKDYLERVHEGLMADDGR